MYPPFIEFEMLLDSEEMQELLFILNYDNLVFQNADNYESDSEDPDYPEEKTCQMALLTIDQMEAIDELINCKINTSDRYKFQLKKKDAKVVTYTINDFFSKHKDKDDNPGSNRSYTVLINLQPCEKGGETVLYLENDLGLVSTVTCRRRGGCLIFPKNVLHEGMPILEGGKTVLFMSYACVLN